MKCEGVEGRYNVCCVEWCRINLKIFNVAGRIGTMYVVLSGVAYNVCCVEWWKVVFGSLGMFICISYIRIFDPPRSF